MPKINKEEYEVLKELDDKWKWIARDLVGELYTFVKEPYKDVEFKHWSNDTCDWSNYTCDWIMFENNLFQFIQWEDEEPHNIAELIREYEGDKTEVKRDSEWMKEEFRKLERTGVIDSWVYRDLWMMANQLDEPEVLSQKWIDENSTNLPMSSPMTRWVSASKLQNLLVPKQELPVIPKYVADWWERDDDSVTMYEGVRIEKKHKLDLVSYFQDRGLIDSLSKVEDWLDENDSIFLDLVNGKPYEVEKEKLYIVQLPTNLEDDLIILDADGDIWKDSWPSRYKMTEQRIKEIDERYWPFAVEVAE